MQPRTVSSMIDYQPINFKIFMDQLQITKEDSQYVRHRFDQLTSMIEFQQINFRTFIEQLRITQEELNRTNKNFKSLHQRLDFITRKINKLEDALGFIPESDNYELAKEHFESLQEKN